MLQAYIVCYCESACTCTVQSTHNEIGDNEKSALLNALLIHIPWLSNFVILKFGKCEKILSCNCVILSTNKGVNKLQYYLVMDLIKLFWYLIYMYVELRKKVVTVYVQTSQRTPLKTIRTTNVTTLFRQYGLFVIAGKRKYTFIISKYKINLHSLRNSHRPEKSEPKMAVVWNIIFDWIWR